MASLLVLTNNSTANPLTLDLSNYVVVNPGDGLDPADPAFTQRVWSRSLLKEGATLALEQLVEREMQFPLKLGPIGGAAGSPQNLSASLNLVQQINQVLQTPGTVMTWQPPGASQATTFDVLSGLVESQYNYRAQQQSWEIVNLRVFTQPLGRTATPRPYASASAIGPLLMISPYAPGGALTIGASTQAGVAGFGGQPQGASSGIFYWGSPSLAGDAPAALQVSIAGPSQGITGNPWMALSLLPDPAYRPLIPASSISGANPLKLSPDGVASAYISVGSNGAANITAYPAVMASGLVAQPLVRAGQHRVIAIARASTTAASSLAQISVLPDGLIVGQSTVGGVAISAGWVPVDLGTYALRASEAAPAALQMRVTASSCVVDITAMVTLPDNATWFLPGTQRFGQIPAYTNAVLVDDVVGDQFTLDQTRSNPLFAASPAGLGASSVLRITEYTRGLVPRPDPKNGLPPLAIFSLNATDQVQSVNELTSAQVAVLERFRYVSG